MQPEQLAQILGNLLQAYRVQSLIPFKLAVLTLVVSAVLADVFGGTEFTWYWATGTTLKFGETDVFTVAVVLGTFCFALVANIVEFERKRKFVIALLQILADPKLNIDARSRELILEQFIAPPPSPISQLFRALLKRLGL